MATWKDGAAYAPVERPDGFATPNAAPLTVGAPHDSGTPGPGEPPAEYQVRDQRSLTEFGDAHVAGRDPRDSFQVSSAALTAGLPGREASRDPKEPFASQSYATAPVGTSELLPPVGSPLPDPVAPVAPTTGPWQPPIVAPTPVRAASPGQYPPPAAPYPPAVGQGQYPPPLPYPPQQPPARRPEEDAQKRRLAQIAGAMCLAGFLFSSGGAFLLIIAGGLGMRTRSLTRAVGPIALGVGILAVLVDLFTGYLGQGNSLTSLVCLGFAFAFFISGLRRN